MRKTIRRITMAAFCLTLFVATLCVVALCASCTAGSKNTAKENTPLVVRVSALNGPSSIPMAYLFENSIGNLPSRAAFEFETAASPDVLLPKLIKGEVDIGVLPVNVAAKIYNSGNGGIILGAIVGDGMLSLITRDAAVTTLADLRGKRVFIAGQGATPEYLFRHLLRVNGISTDAVPLDFSIPAPELAAALVAGKIEYAVVPEPFPTIAQALSPDIRRAIDLQKEYGAPYPITALVVRQEFASAHPDSFRAFLAAYRNAINWTNANPADAGVLVQKHNLGVNAKVAADAIPVSAFNFTAAADAKDFVESLLAIFLDFDSKSVGGKLPDSDFYFSE